MPFTDPRRIAERVHVGELHPDADIEPGFPRELHGIDVQTLLGWAREPATAPSPEIRAALRDRAVRSALAELARAERRRAK